jgi:UDP-glucose 4-epimerase
MKSQKVFVSGIAGFLGSHVAEWLLKQGHEVLGADDLSGGEMANVPKRARFFEHDLRDFEKNKKLLKDVDVVFHAAAFAHDGFSLFSPYLITDNIFSSTQALLSAALEQRVRRFVFCSSMSRYGHQNAPLFTEDMTPQPRTPYGHAKLACEKILENLAEMHGMEWVVCVPHNIIGPRQKFDDPYRNVVAIMINRMLQNKPPIVYGDGEQKRCFSPVEDILQVLPELLFGDKARSQVINVGPDHEFISINQLVGLINRQLGTDFEPVYTAPRPNEVREANCSCEKAKKLLGYRPTSSLNKSLVDMVGWISKLGPRPFQYRFDLEIRSPKTPQTWKERIF